MAEQGKEGWISIKYVGSSPDGVTQAGITWSKKGDIQLAPPAVAKKLLELPDFKDARYNFARKPIVVPEEPKVEEQEEQEDDFNIPLISFEASTKAQITLFAKRNFGIDLDQNFSKVDMVGRVRTLMNRASYR